MQLFSGIMELFLRMISVEIFFGINVQKYGNNF